MFDTDASLSKMFEIINKVKRGAMIFISPAVSNLFTPRNAGLSCN